MSISKLKATSSRLTALTISINNGIQICLPPHARVWRVNRGVERIRWCSDDKDNCLQRAMCNNRLLVPGDVCRRGTAFGYEPVGISAVWELRAVKDTVICKRSRGNTRSGWQAWSGISISLISRSRRVRSVFSRNYGTLPEADPFA